MREWERGLTNKLICEPMTLSRVRILSVFRVVLLMTLLTASLGHARTKVIFRLDDPSSNSDLAFAKKLAEEFHKHRFSLTVGVVPNIVSTDVQGKPLHQYRPISPELVSFLRSGIEDGSFEIALHGYTHESVRRWGGKTEFAGLPYWDQFQKINLGTKAIEEKLGLRPRVFIPPFNTYDLTTVRVLENLGFKTLSANLGGPEDSKDVLRYVPATANLRSLVKAVQHARERPDPDALIVVMFHDYDFLDISPNRGEVSFDYFVQLLDWVSVQPDLTVTTMSMVDDAHGVDAYRYNRKPLIEKFAVPWRPNLYAHLVYRTPRSQHVTIPSHWAHMIGFYCVAMILALNWSWYMGRFAWWVRWPANAMAFITALYMFRDISLLWYMGAFAGFMLAGLTIGAFWIQHPGKPLSRIGPERHESSGASTASNGLTSDSETTTLESVL